jgi:hypothetical protein
MALSRLRRHRRVLGAACGAVLLTSLAAYFTEGAGPLAANYVPASLTAHSQTAARLASSLPADAAISASTSLVPRVSRRPRVYVFPAIEDAEYVFVDVKATPAPTSAGDVYLRLQDLLAGGAWQRQAADDGLVVLHRAPDPLPVSPVQVSEPAVRTFVQPSLVDAALVTSPTGAIDADGPRWTLRTVWHADQPLPTHTRLEFDVSLRTGEHLHLWDVADLWWNPPERWPTGQPVTIEVPGIPVQQFASWSAEWTST